MREIKINHRISGTFDGDVVSAGTLLKGGSANKLDARDVALKRSEESGDAGTK